MTAQSAIPLKWYVPFANGDSSRVELPVTTADPTRASQTLGFPPLTMQPPESGGVPPQGEDFNGGMNQVARIAWWVLNGGGWPFDATFASNSNINGYPNGAKLQSADFRGDWINTADNNQNNPDTNGTNWVPGFQYGVTALTGLTGGTVTPTPAQAAKNSITLAGTLGSALTLILPTWTKNWTITNNTTGAFVTIAKTAAGSGVTIPQNSSPTRVSGDGTNIVQAPENIATPTSATQAAQFGQTTGRLLNGGPLVYASAGSTTWNRNAATTFIVVEVQAAGGGSGGAPATGAGQFSGSAGAASGTYARVLLTAAQAGASQTVGVGAAGTAGAVGSSTGGTGGGSSFGSIVVCPGGPGSTSYGPTGASFFVSAPSGFGAVPTVTAGVILAQNRGNQGGSAFGGVGGGVSPGLGAPGPLGASMTDVGAGAGGTANGASASATAGFAGNLGRVIIWEFA